MNTDTKYVYAREAMDFVTVCTEFCRTLENCGAEPRSRFVKVMRGLLPLLYLKAVQLPPCPDAEGYNEPRVTEADYDYIRARVSATMGSADDFLDVFVEDFKYSEAPVLCTVSENLADIYQSVRDFVEVYRAGYEEAMQVALYDVQQDFENSWGQKAANTLRALHDAAQMGNEE